MASHPQPDWLVERDPETLLKVVVDTRGYARRLRLFGCACARQVWHLLPTDARSAVVVSERLADGKATTTDMRAAAVRLRAATVRLLWLRATPSQIAIEAAGYCSGGYVGVGPPTTSERLEYEPRHAARLAGRAVACEVVGPTPPGPAAPDWWHDAWAQAFDDARAVQAAFVRDIFPPPGFTPQFDPDWRTSTVAALASQMDQSGDFSAVPILADALQDAGCDIEPMLQCSRVPGNVHVRGNWVVDLVLGRQ